MGPLSSIAAIFCAAVVGSTSAGPIVNTTSGQIEGDFFYGLFNVFRGVPYAAPPVGSNSFKRPVAPEPWTGVRQATQWPNACDQLAVFGVPHPEPQSSDCLYLNVFAPAVPHPSGNGYPVLFWAHGGVLYVGSGSLYQEAWGKLVAAGIVVVTINYRLGPVGFFSMGEAKNLGFHDQLLALQWVHDNIAQFGGDPGHVTVGGWSAGAQSAHNLRLSPAARGLLHGTIAASGGAFAPWAIGSPSAASSQQLAQMLGCNQTDEAAILTCMRAIPSATVTAYGTAYIAPPAFGYPFGPDPDDAVYYGTGKTLEELAREQVPIPSLNTVMASDGGFFAAPAISAITSPWKVNSSFDATAFQQALGLLINPSTFPSRHEAIAELTFAYYLGNRDRTLSSNAAAVRGWVKLLTDYAFILPALNEVHHAGYGIINSGAPVYLAEHRYYDTRQCQDAQLFCGAMHGFDLEDMFNMTLFSIPYQFGEAEDSLHSTVLGMYTAFITTGSPGSACDFPQSDGWRHSYARVDEETGLEKAKDFGEGSAEFWLGVVPKVAVMSDEAWAAAKRCLRKDVRKLTKKNCFQGEPGCD